MSSLVSDTFRLSQSQGLLGGGGGQRLVTEGKRVRSLKVMGSGHTVSIRKTYKKKESF